MLFPISWETGGSPGFTCLVTTILSYRIILNQEENWLIIALSDGKGNHFFNITRLAVLRWVFIFIDQEVRYANLMVIMLDM